MRRSTFTAWHQGELSPGLAPTSGGKHVEFCDRGGWPFCTQSAKSDLQQCRLTVTQFAGRMDSLTSFPLTNLLEDLKSGTKTASLENRCGYV
ncbi:hypothetical protein RB195_010359 [Necator americanus]|uniref:Uncharacterized protein n=1 Tax=Necator americanus TaxID=51031 RepID=A0ABR1CXL2_NECAM